MANKNRLLLTLAAAMLAAGMTATLLLLRETSAFRLMNWNTIWAAVKLWQKEMLY